jgi:UPF0755 protein
VRRFLVLLILVLAALSAGAYRWLQQPLELRAESPVDLSIEPGTSARLVAQSVSDAGVQVNATALYWCFRLSGQARQIKAGSYEIEAGITPWRLLRKLVRGDEALRSVTLVEGWNFRQVREALSHAESLKLQTQDMTNDALMAALGAPATAPEGQFYPDTYTYAKGSSDLALLKRAQRAGAKHLQAAWSQRSADSPLKTPEEALILASIVEKETGRTSDRAMVAGVFVNRLRLGMPLQTDPTVIYGLGDKYDGKLHRRDLLADTPYNTYTRSGLPPTPIAMPGKDSLLAAVLPAPTKALYFVARGDGSSQFSTTLEEHNRAVNKYQRGQ